MGIQTGPKGRGMGRFSGCAGGGVAEKGPQNSTVWVRVGNGGGNGGYPGKMSGCQWQWRRRAITPRETAGSLAGSLACWLAGDRQHAPLRVRKWMSVQLLMQMPIWM
jgi:hypothetical protein